MDFIILLIGSLYQNIIIKNNEPIIIGFNYSYIITKTVISPIICNDKIVFNLCWSNDVKILLTDRLVVFFIISYFLIALLGLIYNIFFPK